MTSPKTESEKWFEAYAAERGLEGADVHQPDLGRPARPDYRIHRGGPGAICEVKEFTTSSLERRLEGVSYATVSGRDHFGTVRNKINEAAKKQLRPYAGGDDALVVVLANPLGIQVPIYQSGSVFEAMYGDGGWVMQIDPATGGGDQGEFALLDDGVFGGGRHRYVSAVAVLHRRKHAADAIERWRAERSSSWDAIADRDERVAATLEAHNDPSYEEAAQTPGTYHYIQVYSTASTATGEAVRVPRDLFNGPRDQYWTMNAATGSCLELGGRVEWA